MKIVFENVNIEVLDVARIARGMARVVQQVPLSDQMTVVLTGDFEGSIQTRSQTDPAYSAERLGGVGLASAMTMRGEGTECVIVANAAFFVSGATAEELDGARLLAHEGWHAAILQRGEETHDIRLRLGLGDGAQGFFQATSGIAMGEYRVERSLCNEGWWPLSTYVGQTPKVLAKLRERLTAAVLPGEDFADRAWEFITQDLHQALTLLAYLAGEELASDRPRLPTPILESDDWQELVGAFWDQLLDRLEEVPPADESTHRERLDVLVNSLAAEVRAWLMWLGFTMADGEDGIHVFYSGRFL